MAINVNSIKTKKLRAIGNRVLVTDMEFGEQKTASGLIISSDDGQTRGVYPRWGKVYAKGPKNNDPYEKGQWILVEHGRWTRGMKIDIESEGEVEMRMVEAESILAYSETKPNDVRIGNEYSDGDSADIRPEDFGAN
jgi:co-chaperonin GroES (HSP10)